MMILAFHLLCKLGEILLQPHQCTGNLYFLRGIESESQIRITDFINSLKSKFALAGKKRSSSTFSAKKQKISKTDETSTTKERAHTTYDLKEIADDVRKRITDWLRKQAAAGENYLSELKEFKDYSKVRPLRTPLCICLL